MNRSVKFALAVLVLGALALGFRLVQGRRSDAPTAPPATSAAASAPVPALDLRDGDLVMAQMADLSRTQALSGSVRAVSTAIVKAKVAGELRHLGPREGDSVRAGQVVGDIDTTEFELRVKQAVQQAEAARAQVDIARRQLDNNRALVAQGFISATALDTSVANHAAAQASLQAALATADLARKAQADTVLKSPISGTVSQRLAQPGERVAVDARVLEVVDLSRLELEAALPAADAGTLRAGATAELRVEGLPDPVSAQVVRLNPATQAGTRAVLVYLSLQPAPGLRVGLFARGTVALEQRRALSLPLSAVRLDDALPYVVVLDGSALRRRTVKTGARGLVDRIESVEITDGLRDGDRILRGSLGTVRDGTPARLVAAAH
ncbi:efflux RND transporter periplasmic adaptor subunit [Sphaerotilus montanus]|uniref:RND family efflux transporter MFP subunit n=1 Tax=Sphaerotilus montanus TaxID=522889 RepID=A0A7Y9UA54_9BURK|nr:efflux RND transporter periplasmic adaptor subunit [Sphaerotilus montanus]NYG31094.1 RND family efflux transporter MFP subunit [Sphaerotilus montanus]NZD55080.1 efflux RND transporter periplasmic adaptor subunit [Sphaerotilus montanus]